MRPVPPQPQHSPADEGKPPIFRTWMGIYAAVLAYLTALILLFYIFTKSFS